MEKVFAFIACVASIQLLCSPLILCAPSSDHITQHWKDGAQSLQKAAYETGANLSNGIRDGANSAYSGFTSPIRRGWNSLFNSFGQLTNSVRNVITKPITSASDTMTKSLQAIVPSSVTNIPNTVRNIPTNLSNAPGAIGNGVWNGSSQTVNSFGRSLTLSCRVLNRFAKRLENTGHSIENYQWVRVPRQQNAN